jgi:hypothetical protein
MTLNRASRKEADARLSLLRKPVTLHVFTLRFEDSACRETRTAAEELAEATSRLSVEIDEAAESGDLLRKYRVESFPSIVVAAKDAPDLRVYGAPTSYGLVALLEALTLVGTPLDPKTPLDSSVREAAGKGPRSAVRLDIVGSRRMSVTAEASAALWRVACADFAAGGPFRTVASLRIIEDFPHWAALAPPESAQDGRPFLLVDGAAVLAWPFADQDIIDALR